MTLQQLQEEARRQLIYPERYTHDVTMVTDNGCELTLEAEFYNDNIHFLLL